MGYVLGSKSLEQLTLVHPKMQSVVGWAIQVTTQDFAVHDGGRTAEEQHALFLKGATQKDGYRRLSNHQVKGDGFGHAVDLVPWTSQGLKWDWELIYPIAVAMARVSHELRIPVRWGGNWYEQLLLGDVEDMKASVERYKMKHPGPDFIDGPHYELIF